MRDERVAQLGSTITIFLNAELSHVFTQNEDYMDTITKFRSAVGSSQTVNHYGVITNDSSLAAAHDIPDEFVVAARGEFHGGISNYHQALREMQVSLHAYSKVGAVQFGNPR